MGEKAKAEKAKKAKDEKAEKAANEKAAKAAAAEKAEKADEKQQKADEKEAAAKKEAERRRTCNRDTEGTCNVFKCYEFRGANCEKSENHRAWWWDYRCICPMGKCAENGICN